MKTVPHSRRCELLALLVVVAGGALAGGQEIRPVSIELKERAVVTGQCVRLADLAELAGGADILRRRLADIDVDQLPPDGQTQMISRTQLDYRLRLAGIPRELFTFTGAASTYVLAERRPVPPDRLVDAAIEAVCHHLPWRRDELSFRLVQPIVAQLPTAATDERVTFQAEPNRPEVALGRVQINVTIRVNDEKRLALPVFFDVWLLQEVALCRRPVEKGEVLTEADILRERRAVPPNDRHAARPDTIIGKAVHRPLAAGQMVTTTDVENAAGVEGDWLVRSGQPVRMTVKLGTLDVVAFGTALQNGGLGQTVRVCNADTNKIVVGSVVGPKTVEINSGKP